MGMNDMEVFNIKASEVMDRCNPAGANLHRPRSEGINYEAKMINISRCFILLQLSWGKSRRILSKNDLEKIRRNSAAFRYNISIC
jgi:hypothetical protein